MSQIGVPTIRNLVRSSSTTSSFEIFLSSGQSGGNIAYEVTYYVNEDNTFDQVRCLKLYA